MRNGKMRATIIQTLEQLKQHYPNPPYKIYCNPEMKDRVKACIGDDMCIEIIPSDTVSKHILYMSGESVTNERAVAVVREIEQKGENRGV